MNEICFGCGHEYTLGITGVVDGCDVCMEIVRNPVDNSIIEVEPLTEVEQA